MKLNRLIAACVLLIGTTAHADSKSLTRDQLRERLEVKGEIFVLDASGKQLLVAPGRTALWRFSSKNEPMQINFGSSSNDYGQIYLHQVWDVLADGSIHVVIEEFAKQIDDPKTGSFKKHEGLLKKAEFTIENFAPITWKVQNIGDKNVVMRLTPSLRDDVEARTLSTFPIAGKDVTVTDSQGYAWADHASFEGTYVGLTTHRGTIVLSYQMFPGAKEIGRALGNDIEVKLADDLKVYLRSDSAFLPATVRAKVYGLYVADKRSSGPRSVISFDTSTEDRLLARLKQL